MLKFNKLFFAFNIVIVFVIATVVIVYAWTNPSQNPPDGTGAITVDTNNNVGIGVTDPGTARLKSVTGEGNAGWFINNSPATYAALIVQNKGGGWGIYDNWSGKHYLAGSLGIGANPPSEKLDVAGYVKGQTGLCIGSDCRTAWPSVSVGTGSGLTGGPITTSGTISILAGGVTSAHIADGTIINADISAAAAISAIKIQDVWVNAAGDTMTGNLTAPAVSVSALIIGGQNVGVNDGVVNQGTDPIDWTRLKSVPFRFVDGVITWQELANVPAGFADGVDNTGTCTISASGCYWKNVSNINSVCNAANEVIRGFNPDNDDVYCCQINCQ
ncbi:MAG: hypothetical protein A2745_00190 [Candidatus Harrisonbacteria bacterium RIFCSPHIGHO2_01_FULL_44_13]|nr:MAG: hypothetical protein A2745_00190 [Candidatus Harrisonbacteria bacterium RIFCSPHIGHO2_01_FULL_44_13]